METLAPDAAADEEPMPVGGASLPDIRAALARTGERVEAVLSDLLHSHAASGEIVRPERLLGAMRHGVLNGGKRLRPALVVEAAALFGVERSNPGLLRTAAALECIHCYSLIHDDLPAMDDDDTRRGQPTVHVAFDEATAILAGDALMTLAFQAVAEPETHPDTAVRIALVSRLAVASGIGGMAGGQMFDLAFEAEAPDEAASRRMQAMKTGALIEAACGMGAIHAGASDSAQAALREYGLAIGLAFQLADDILDETADADALGKAVGKDADQGKATFVYFHGLDGARARLREEIERAHAALAPFGSRAETLKGLATFVAERDH